MTALIALAVAAALQAGLHPGMFCRLVERESDWDVRARTASSRGLCQINGDAWDWHPLDPFEPQENLRMGAWILKWNLRYRFDAPDQNEREWQAVASYTLGHGAVNRLISEHGDGWRDALSEPVRRYVEAIVERQSYTLDTLESDAWALVQPLDLWSYQRGDCWIVGDMGPFQLFAEGDTFDAARDAYCRALIEAAEFAARRGEMYDDYLRRVAVSGQSGQVIATEIDDCEQYCVRKVQ